MRDQWVPFHDSITGPYPAPVKKRVPTAVQAAGDEQDTPLRKVFPLLGFGTRAHRDPFHDSMRFLPMPLLVA
jgi:hypothetical protein